MFGLFKKKKDLVGIDIGSSSVKLVQLWQTRDGYQLLNAAIMPLPPEAIVDNSLMDTAAVVDAVKNLVASLGIKSKDVACSISGNAVIIRKIILPVMTSEELEDQISWEAEQYIPFDIKDVHIDFQILGQDSIDPSKIQVLLVASKKDIINDYVALFNDAGLSLNVMDVDSFAVQNAFELNTEVSDEVRALVNVGAGVMNINVVKAETSLFTRDVQMGGNQYTEEIQKQLGVSAQEAETMKMLAVEQQGGPLADVIGRVNDSLAQEIRRSVDFYNSTASGEERITRVSMCGGCSKMAGLKEAVAAKLGMDVELLNPFERIKYGEKDFDPEYLQEIAPLMAVGVGLAIRRVGDK
ncbi:type IV pilus biogenesis protein PilM [Trichlorobacter lovleyi]|uniref:Type IV pilus assembly protein PilM n=1 Tax=Trichlorobacter lovleyi (strain ATCC BAA-1151 / DSM 17278 / SZ) TaxID=398767 RepID=B3E9T0_TRIL1|nr:type IV pilus assembly protein PilM [Trichlorobacter lovleyi]ACD95356.1 type IV pilus assembly protein PilM [Trichlorobacter lovleyi SZ]